MYKKGESGNLKGKPKGTVSKFTNLKNEFIKVYKDRGGSGALWVWADENPTDFYKMIAKMLPAEVDIKSSEGLMINISPRQVTKNQNKNEDKSIPEIKNIEVKSDT